MSNLQKIGPATYLMPKEGGMRVPGLIIAPDEFLQDEELEHPLQQLRNVAHLPGIVGYSIAMPDIHWGYGFPIGGVAATDASTGVISPGGVGYDINCGVRLALVPIPFSQIHDTAKEALLAKIFELVPSGIGRGQSKTRDLSERDYDALLVQGARWSIERGFGFPEDLEHMESHGCIPGAHPEAISSRAKERGKNQLGSIGSGNHFVEIGAVQKLFREEIANAWGIELHQTYILIHSGSRGFGHQVCQDALNTFIRKCYNQDLPDQQLVAAPISSPEGKAYFAAMAGAANFAFNNRQQILHEVRKAFKEVLHISPISIRLLYDVCHNIAKFEEYDIDGQRKRLCVHRKGATRAFGKGAEELSPLFRETGQPVLVPGDMLRASYLMVGLGNERTWCSSCHGAGRARSRVQSMAAWRGQNPVEYMAGHGVYVMATSQRTIAEEMPDAYKDVDIVVRACKDAGLADPIVRLQPHLVVKG